MLLFIPSRLHSLIDAFVHTLMTNHPLGSGAHMPVLADKNTTNYARQNKGFMKADLLTQPRSCLPHLPPASSSALPLPQ